MMETHPDEELRSRASFRWEAPCIAAWIVTGLALDAHDHQTAVDLVTGVLFVVIYTRSARARRRSMLACLLLATIGELVLALVWGVYTYRLGALPIFVPPGHVLLFLLGQDLAQRLRPRLALPLALGIVAGTIAFVAVTHDTISLPLVALFALACTHASQCALYVVMFLLALAMELWGTWLGNWTWNDPAPGTGLGVHNPPLAVGAFYVVLDRLVLLLSRRS